MSKTLSLTFALISTALMATTAAMLVVSPWASLAFAFVTVAFLGFSFVFKARQRRKAEARNR